MATQTTDSNGIGKQKGLSWLYGEKVAQDTKPRLQSLQAFISRLHKNCLSPNTQESRKKP